MDKKQLRKKAKSGNVKVKTVESHEIKSDVQGSYTGVPEDKYEMPVQDADDL